MNSPYIKLMLAALLAAGPALGALAADDKDGAEQTTVINRVKGGLEGVDNDTFSGGDGNGTGMVSLKVIRLRLHKATHGLTDKGVMNEEPLGNNARVVLGQLVYFTLYVENLTDAELYDIYLRDELDEAAFAYEPGSMAMAVTDVGRVARDQDFSTALSDSEDSDIAAIADLKKDVQGLETISVGQIDKKNGIVTLAPGKRLTIRFKVQVL